jgi:HAD superfamily hydrolase (TIGR01509 family)
VIRVVAFDLMDTVVRDPYREALEAATGRTIDELFARRSPRVYPALERDEIDEDTYWRSYADVGIDVDPAEFHRVRRDGTRWLPGMGELLDGLAGVVERVAASNYPRWVDDLAAERLGGRFDHVLASCHLGVRKPDTAFFQAMLARLRRSADEVLFVDDRVENVGGAREVGIAAHRYRSADEVRRWLAGHGVTPRSARR